MIWFQYAKNKEDENRPVYYDGLFVKIKTKTKRKERQTALYNENVKTNIDKESAKPNY
jgi:hypothetical protein